MFAVGDCCPAVPVEVCPDGAGVVCPDGAGVVCAASATESATLRIDTNERTRFITASWKYDVTELLS
jgi:hypothetical protein